MAPGSIVDVVRRYLDVLRDHGIEASFCVLFGSHVRGDAHAWSDVDVVVVAPFFDEHRDYSDATCLWRLTLLVDSTIEPIPCGLKEWFENDSRPILEVARREGQVIEASVGWRDQVG